MGTNNLLELIDLFGTGKMTGKVFLFNKNFHSGKKYTNGPFQFAGI